jgi:NAD(P)-dependent dehydrogenase (short-subunit alcohol dehydrogenase family)
MVNAVLLKNHRRNVLKIIVVGGTGTIGQSVVKALKKQHEVIVVSRSSKQTVDVSSTASIRKMYDDIGPFDALISTIGSVIFKPLDAFTLEDFNVGLQHKLMGQVQLVTEGLKTIRPNGSFTLTSGILNKEPIRGGVSAAMVNDALEGFVRAASLELPHVRLNCVSPTVITEALPKYADYFKGFIPVPADTVAQAYVKSVEGIARGQIDTVGF